METALTKLDKARTCLMEAKTLQEVKSVLDMAKAAELYAKEQGMAEESIKYAQDIKLEAQRRLGQILKEAPKNEGSKFKKDTVVDSNDRRTPTLKELNISKDLSSDSQKLASMDEELFKDVKSSKISIKEASKIAKMPKPEQKKVIEQIKSGAVKSVGHALAKNREEVKVEAYKSEVIAPIVKVESYETWLPKQDKCDLLITDPPYITEFKNKKEYNEFVHDFMFACESKVKDTGSMYICIGGYPEELQAYLNLYTKMKLQNVMIWTYNNTIGTQSSEKYIQNYQCILYYRNESSKLNGNSINDKLASFTINAPDGRLGDRYHTWQKPMELAEKIILNSSKKGDVILDPFACTGTFLLAANKLGRIGKGCDISKDNLDLAIKRGCRYE